MKLLPISPDANGVIDGTLMSSIVSHLPTTESMLDADAVVVPIAWHPGYVFNTSLLAIKRPVIILDYLEMGWDAGRRENVLGRGALQQFGHLDSPEWEKLDAWVRDNTQALILKRELHERDRSFNLRPAEFTCLRDVPPVQTKSEFDSRPLEVFSSWGLSNPVRPQLHGDIFKGSQTCGFQVIDGWDQEGRWEKRTWATIHSPWYIRKPIETVDRWNQMAKLSVSLPGAGKKCFRSSEAPRGSIMAMQTDDLEWSYPWVHGENCIRLEPGKEFGGLEYATDRISGSLYDIYVAAQATCENYRSEKYVRDYIVPCIASVL